MIGYGRSKKEPYGRFSYIYADTAVGASLSILLSIYEYHMMQGQWAGIVAEVGMKFDASRFGSQVISGIGFLAAGAGFYACVITALIVLFIVLELMVPLEHLYKRHRRIITLFVQFDAAESIDDITSVIRKNNAVIDDLETERMQREGDKYPSAVINIKLSKDNASHSDMPASIAELNCVYSIEELIA